VVNEDGGKSLEDKVEDMLFVGIKIRPANSMFSDAYKDGLGCSLGGNKAKKVGKRLEGEFVPFEVGFPGPYLPEVSLSEERGYLFDP
jgi:hypothetical protein